MEEPALGHEWEDESDCEIIVSPTCEVEGEGVFECTRPGCDATKNDKVAPLGHIWEDESEWEIATPPTCEEEGEAIVECIREGCDATKIEKVAPLGHDLEFVEGSEPTCEDDGWTDHYACMRDGCDYKEGYELLPALGHALVDVPAKAPTCVEKGWKDYKYCERPGCGYIEGYEELAPLGHEWEDEAECDIITPPTCLEKGEGIFECTREGCDATKIDSVEALGHDFDKDGKVTTPPTCTEQGIVTFECLRDGCDVAFTKELPELGHLWEGESQCEIVVPPTCEEEGEGIFECMRDGCDATENGKILPLGHDWDDGHVSVEPTCTEKGITTYTCTRGGCGKTYDLENLDPLGHDWEDPNCIEPATCSRCGITSGEPIGHNYMPATCTAPETCDRCGVTQGEPLGHDWVEATCIAPRYCKRCSATEGDPLGHDPSEPDATNHCATECKRCGIDLGSDHADPIVDSDDSYKRKCPRCGDELTKDGFEPAPGRNPDPTNILYAVTASTTGKMYLRIQSRGHYTMTGWSSATPDFFEYYTGALSFSPNYLTSLAAANVGASQGQVVIESFTGEYPLPYYPSITGSYEIQLSDTYYEGSAGKYTVPYYNYNYSWSFSTPVPEEYAELERAYADFVYMVYREEDAATSAYLESIIALNGWAFDRANSYEEKRALINSVASFVQNYRYYDTTYECPELNGASNMALAFFDKGTYPSAKAICYHYATAATLLYRALGMPSRIVFGATAETVAGKRVNVGEDRGHAWVEVYIDGTGWVMVEVTGSAPPLPILEISVNSTRLQYNGMEQFVDLENFGTVKGLPEGYTCTFKVKGSATEAGYNLVLKPYDVEIKDEFNNIVPNSEFKFIIEEGYIHIYYDKLVFESGNFSHTYNGENPEGCKVYWLASGNLIPEHSDAFFNYTCTAEPGIGSLANKFTVDIWVDSKSVAQYYWIEYRFGTISTERIPITITAESDSVTYDPDSDEVLTCDVFTYTPTLLEGHTIVCEIVGEQPYSTYGSSPNKILNYKIVIYTEDGEEIDVTGFYSVSIVDGTLSTKFDF